ncbi:MAG TPA: hypothetical protein VEC16_05100 [Alphaproteobacteria bacterium]|nr:hypothetical protein [Alphaproteobacteria bacterium]
MNKPETKITFRNLINKYNNAAYESYEEDDEYPIILIMHTAS